MQSISFLPLSDARRRNGALRPPHAEIAPAPAKSARYALRMVTDNCLECIPLPDDASPTVAGDGRAATLVAAGAGDATAWFLIPQSDALAVNGAAPPMRLVQLDPGAVVALGSACWLVVAVQRPRPMPAPAELAERPCPVCGGELRIAPVVQCGCGRWTHLERPDEPNAPDALNCFLAAAECPDCGRAAALEPQMTPEPPEKLLPALAAGNLA